MPWNIGLVEVSMLIGRVLGWVVALLGLFLVVYGFSVPAIVAGSYIQGGVVMIAGGGGTYIHISKQKEIY